MNYFAHGYRFLDDPYFMVGTALPDWLGVANRNVRVPPIRVRPWIDAVDPTTATIARGILQHHDDDAEFHVTRDFAELNIRFAKEIKRIDPSAHEMVTPLLAHIVPELILDSILIEESPGLIDQYYRVMTEIDLATVLSVVEQISGREPTDLARFHAIFLHEQFLRDYADDGRLFYRLSQIIKRVNWGPMPQGFENLLPEMRKEVVKRRAGLLHFLE